MKLNRFFMLGLAGLAFAACGNEEEMDNGMPQGYGAVTIKIASPVLTKAGAAHDENVQVTPAPGSNVVVTLDAAVGGDTPITIPADEWSSRKTVTFWGVKDPKSVTVSMNGGTADYENVTVETTTLQAVENVSAYGYTNNIPLTGSTEINDGTTYQMYNATVQLAIPVARLEVSGIQHITTEHPVSNCKYSTLAIAGVYLDNVCPKGTGVTYSSGTFSLTTAIPTDYCFDGTPETGTGVEAVLKENIPENDENFLAPDKVWPIAGNAYGYNFFGVNGADKLPKFKIYFSESEAENPTEPLPAPRFAMITQYKTTDGTEITKFEPGHIYRITEAKLLDKNIIGDEGGNTLYGVEVIVQEATWTVVSTTADWAE